MPDNPPAGPDEGKEAKYKVVVAGQEMEVPLTELLNGYQRQADYTKKTQELSEQQKDFNRRVEEEATALYLKALEEGKVGTQPDKKDDEDPGAEQSKRLKELEDRLAQQERTAQQKEADRILDGHIKAVQEKFPKADIDKVLVSFYKEAKETTDPAKFFLEKGEALHKAAEAYDQKIIDDYVARRSNGSRHESGGSGSGTGSHKEPAKTFEEAAERARARLAG